MWLALPCHEGFIRTAGLRRLERIPERGPLAANTLAGTVAGCRQALELSAHWGVIGKIVLVRDEGPPEPSVA